MKGYILAIISGILLVVSFAPFGMGIVAWIALVPLFFAIDGETPRGAFLKGWTSGGVFFLGTVYWVVHSMYLYGGVPLYVGCVVMLLLVAYLAVYPALFSAVTVYGMEGGGVATLFFVPSLWVASEYMRGYLFTGFPWVALGYSQVVYPAVVQIGDITGVWGVSFVVVMVNVCIFSLLKGAVRRWQVHSIYWMGGTTLVVLTSVVIYGYMRIDGIAREIEGWDTITIGIAQGNIDQSIKWDSNYRDYTLDTYRDLTLRAVQRGSDLVVWPETAIPFYLGTDSELDSFIEDMLRESGVILLAGAPSYSLQGGRNRYYNSVFLLSPEGRAVDRYDKVHLVPFGEYVPFREVLSFVDKLVTGIGDFSPGLAFKPLEYGGHRYGVIICFESIFPELSRGLVEGGAEVIFNLTNDAWFGRTSAPYQHFDMAVLRAVETRTFVVRAANTGISGIVDPTGRVIERSGLFRKELIVHRVGLRQGRESLYTRYGDLFAMGCFVFPVVVSGARSLGLKRRLRR